MALTTMKFTTAATMAWGVLNQGKSSPIMPCEIIRAILVKARAFMTIAPMAARFPRSTLASTANANSQIGPPLRGPTEIITDIPMP